MLRDATFSKMPLSVFSQLYALLGKWNATEFLVCGNSKQSSTFEILCKT